jgi:hypothetical protein
MLNHGGDFSSATKSLAKEGFGMRTNRRNGRQKIGKRQHSDGERGNRDSMKMMSEEEIDELLDDPASDLGHALTLGTRGNQSERESCAEALLRLTKDANIFHTPEGRTYANVSVDGHRENHDLRSPGFRRWLTRAHYTEKGLGISSEAFQQVLGVLEAKATFDGELHTAHVRVAGDASVLVSTLVIHRGKRSR